MSPNQNAGLILAIAGYIVLLLGALGYMGVYSQGRDASYVLVIIGSVGIIASVVSMYLIPSGGYKWTGSTKRRND